MIQAFFKNTIVLYVFPPKFYIENNAYAKFLGNNKEYYGIFEIKAY